MGQTLVKKYFLQRMALLITAFLSSCASLSREECLYGDWFALGVQDGRAGQVASQVVFHQDACKNYGVKVDKARYLAGREQGLQQYCQLNNALDTGLRGQRYQAVCPAQIDADFRYYNETAYQVYESRSALKSLDSSLSDKENSLTDKKLSDKQRQNIRSQIRRLDDERRVLRDDLYNAERQLDRLIEETRHR